MSEQRVENVIIVGGGPAGYTAALYTSRANLEPLVIEGFQWGGQLQNTTDVENYPGYPDGIMGPEMMQQFRDQAERFGTRFITDDVTGLELSDGRRHPQGPPGRRGAPRADDHPGDGRGAQAAGDPGRDGARGTRRLHLRRLRWRLLQGSRTSSLSAAATRRWRTRSSSPSSPTTSRSSTAATSSAPRRSCSTAPPRSENISFKTPFVPEQFVAGEDGKLHSVLLKNAETGEEEELEVGGAFVAIGHVPRSELVEGVDRHRRERLRRSRSDGSTRTNLEGVFAVGDLVDHTYRQAVTAAGTGCMGALDAEWYLRDTPPSPEAHWQKGGEPVEVAPTPTATASA